MTRTPRGLSQLAFAATALLLVPPARGQDAPAPDEDRPSVLAVIEESLAEDVYDEGKWRPLTFRSFFAEGWLEPWAAAPAGRDGLTPRHGWLGAFNGVFYRLWIADFSYANALAAPYQGSRYESGFTAYLPASRRFELLIAETALEANGTADPRRGFLTRTGDLTVGPRFLLAESEATSHVLDLFVRAPTGSKATGGGLTSLTPRYAFWTNPVGPWVVRGSASLTAPLGDSPPLTTFDGGLAIGRYLTPHDAPFGDLVFYAACDVSVPLGRSASTGTVATLGPGTRFHLGDDFYLLNYWGLPVTGPHPEAFTAQFALVKVF